MSGNSQARVQGKTGILSMDSQRRIHRQLTLARIDASGPVKIASIATGAMERIAVTNPMYGVGPRLAAVGLPGLDTVRP
jgi:hypothetical protein